MCVAKRAPRKLLNAKREKSLIALLAVKKRPGRVDLRDSRAYYPKLNLARRDSSTALLSVDHAPIRRERNIATRLFRRFYRANFDPRSIKILRRENDAAEVNGGANAV